MPEGTVVHEYRHASNLFVVEFTTAASMTNSQVTTRPYNFGFRVIDFWIAQLGGNGGSGDTVTLKAVNAGGTERSITDALDANKNDTIVTRAGALDDAAYDLVDGESLRVETASDAVVKAYALCMRN